MRRAADYYSLAAENDNKEAQYNLALLYFNGHGVQKDKKKAFALFEMAAHNGDPDAQHQVAILYKRGKGTPPNDKMAAEWAHKAMLQVRREPFFFCFS